MPSVSGSFILGTKPQYAMGRLHQKHSAPPATNNERYLRLCLGRMPSKCPVADAKQRPGLQPKAGLSKWAHGETGYWRRESLMNLMSFEAKVLGFADESMCDAIFIMLLDVFEKHIFDSCVYIDRILGAQ